MQKQLYVVSCFILEQKVKVAAMVSVLRGGFKGYAIATSNCHSY